MHVGALLSCLHQAVFNVGLRSTVLVLSAIAAEIACFHHSWPAWIDSRAVRPAAWVALGISLIPPIAAAASLVPALSKPPPRSLWGCLSALFWLPGSWANLLEELQAVPTTAVAVLTFFHEWHILFTALMQLERVRVLQRKWAWRFGVGCSFAIGMSLFPLMVTTLLGTITGLNNSEFPPEWWIPQYVAGGVAYLSILMLTFVMCYAFIASACTVRMEAFQATERTLAASQVAKGLALLVCFANILTLADAVLLLFSLGSRISNAVESCDSLFTGVTASILGGVWGRLDERLNAMLRGLGALQAGPLLASTRESRIAYVGQILQGARKCVVSFPGIETELWKRLTEGRKSVACVFLTDKASGLGEHTLNPEDPEGKCYCKYLYKNSLGTADFLKVEQNPSQDRRSFAIADAAAMGVDLFVETDHLWIERPLERFKAVRKAKRRCRKSEGKAPWGCQWFAKWKENVETAHSLGQELVVCYFRGGQEAGKPLEQLGTSQKAEVRWLMEHGLHFEPVDCSTFDMEDCTEPLSNPVSTETLSNPVSQESSTSDMEDCTETQSNPVSQEWSI